MLFCFVVFLYFSLATKQRIEREHIEKNARSVEIIASSLHSVLAAQETVLNLLGSELANQKHVDDDDAQTLFASTLKIDKSIAALGFLTPDGNYRYISNNADSSNLPNLIDQPESRDSFLRALKTEKMVLGRTYFFEPLNKWIIPIRKAIRNEHGEVVAVATAALDLSNSATFSSRVFRLEEDQYVKIIRAFDYYVQHASWNRLDPSLYLGPVDDDVITAAKKALETSYKTTETVAQKSDSVHNLKFEVGREEVFGSFKYDPDYELWIVSVIPSSAAFYKALSLSGTYFLIFLSTISMFFVLFRSVARAEEKAREALTAQANSDFLTGLPNRNYLHTQSHKWINGDREPFSLVYLDMDNFKNVNDSYGHLFGDQVIREISERIRDSLNESSIVTRYGGDEFVILSKIVDDESLLSESQALSEELSSPYHVNGHSFILGASIGIAKYPEHGEELDALVRKADMAMYESKKSRNKAKLYLPGLETRRLKDIRIEQELRNALERKEIFMMYQPQVDCEGRLCGVESLVRWQNPSLGFVPPDQFISIAEETGQISALGDFIIKTALEGIDALNTDSVICPAVSINISAKQFLDPDFVTKTYEAINSLNQKIDVCLEITESLFIEDLDYVISILNNFHADGIKISLDDFGTGYSSLGVLKKLPLDELKIDKSFVDDILTDDSAQKMIKNIIDIGKNLNLKVLAEGVETYEQKEMLEKFGCDRFQGYYFSKPLKPDDFLEYICDIG